MSQTYPSVGWTTDPGRVRKENQDNLVVRELPYGTLLLVADGMGGHQDGGLASSIAVETITGMLEEAHPDFGNPEALEGILWESITEANRRIWARSRKEGGASNMGTTVVLAVVVKSRAYIAHVGDSRLYHVRAGLPAQVTKDHTTVQAMVDHGIISVAQSKVHPEANKLARALGVKENVEPEVRSAPIHLENGDVLVLCSDGLYDVVTDDQIADLSSRFGAQAASEQLVQTANDGGGPDNVSVVVYQFGKPRVRHTLTRQEGPLLRKLWWHLPLWAWAAIAALAVTVAGVGVWKLLKSPPPTPSPTAAATVEAPVVPGKDGTGRPLARIKDVGKVSPRPTPGCPESPAGLDTEEPDVMDAGPPPETTDEPDVTAGSPNSRVAETDASSVGNPLTGTLKVLEESGGTFDAEQRPCAPDDLVGEDKKKVISFLEDLGSAKEFIVTADYAEASKYYQSAKDKYLGLGVYLSSACGDELEGVRVQLKDAYLGMARKATPRTPKKCKAARGRAQEAYTFFGASEDEVKAAISGCERKESKNPGAPGASGSNTGGGSNPKEELSGPKNNEDSHAQLPVGAEKKEAEKKDGEERPEQKSHDEL